MLQAAHQLCKALLEALSEDLHGRQVGLHGVQAQQRAHSGIAHVWGLRAGAFSLMRRPGTQPLLLACLRRGLLLRMLESLTLCKRSAPHKCNSYQVGSSCCQGQAPGPTAPTRCT